MDNKYTDSQKSLILLFCTVILAFLLFTILFPFRDYTLTKPVTTANIDFNDIAYLGKGYDSEVYLMDETGTEQWGSTISIPLFETQMIFGEPVYKNIRIYNNSIVNTVWSSDGNILGVLYVIYENGNVDLVYPALITKDNQIFVCHNGDSVFTYYDFSFQIFDEERIIINTGNQPDNYLSLYNMHTCREEAVFYDGIGEEEFAVSSRKWLAINEEVDGDMMLNVYDENMKLIYSENEFDNYEFVNWSNDGNQLGYHVYQPASISEINQFFVHDFQTNETWLLGEEIYNASFSPDGNQLVVESPVNRIAIVDMDNMEKTEIEEGKRPTWRP